MSCIIPTRTKILQQCGTYRLYLFSASTADVIVFVENIATSRKKHIEVTPTLISKDGIGISYVEFTFAALGTFLNSNSDFNINAVRATAETPEDSILIYLGMDDGDEILAETIIASFEESYNEDEEKETLLTQAFKL